jgi:multiple antibiotic resistance protein
VSLLYAWLNSLVGLVIVVNPLLGVSVIAALTEHETPEQRRGTARAAALTVAIVLSISAVCGEAILSVFGIGIPEFQVGGGILILLMAVTMLQARIGDVRHTEEEAHEAHGRASVGVVPLGLPLLAGPGAISTAIIYAHDGGGRRGLAGVTDGVADAALGQHAGKADRPYRLEHCHAHHGAAVVGDFGVLHHERLEGAVAGVGRAVMREV